MSSTRLCSGTSNIRALQYTGKNTIMANTLRFPNAYKLGSTRIKCTMLICQTLNVLRENWSWTDIRLEIYSLVTPNSLLTG